MQAVLELGVGGTGGYGPGNSLPNVTSMLHLEQMHLDANSLAQFGVHSSGIIRSRFSFLAATRALHSGIKLQGECPRPPTAAKSWQNTRGAHPATPCILTTLIFDLVLNLMQTVSSTRSKTARSPTTTWPGCTCTRTRMPSR